MGLGPPGRTEVRPGRSGCNESLMIGVPGLCANETVGSSWFGSVQSKESSGGLLSRDIFLRQRSCSLHEFLGLRVCILNPINLKPLNPKTLRVCTGLSEVGSFPCWRAQGSLVAFFTLWSLGLNALRYEPGETQGQRLIEGSGDLVSRLKLGLSDLEPYLWHMADLLYPLSL